jgi:hypothetical protein
MLSCLGPVGTRVPIDSRIPIGTRVPIDSRVVLRTEVPIRARVAADVVVTGHLAVALHIRIDVVRALEL